MRYTSPLHVLGLPLVEVRFGEATRSVGRAWIAIGDIAVGRLIAVGGFAVAPLAVGGLTIGVLPMGGVTLGLFSVGGLALGMWAVGGAALALHAALGGLAVATEFAVGGAAFARHANDAEALAFFAASPAFSFARAALAYARWLPLVVLCALLFFQFRRAGRLPS